MGNLAELELKYTYRSDQDNLVRDFYIPLLRRSSTYQRAVGYFTSNGLNLAAQGIAHLLSNAGQIQLVCSPALQEDDLKAIREGTRKREEVLLHSAERQLRDIEYHLIRDRLGALAWLIAEGRLQIKLALRVDKKGFPVGGIYHEKLGIFSDAEGDSVAFSGSSNETVGGLVSNFEAVDVFCSWRDPERCELKHANFTQLWDNQTEQLQILDFTDVSEELLRQYKQTRKPTFDPTELDGVNENTRQEAPRIPITIKLRDYQQEAIANWFGNNGRGIYEMATGSGKTYTALGTASKVTKKDGLDALVIIVPFQHLVTQWKKDCEAFGMRPVLAFKSSTKWVPQLTARLFRAGKGGAPFLSVITTNSTFGGREFQSKLQYFPQNTMLIADEVHNLGAKRIQRLLPEQIPLRLGLSATPERWFDPEGTRALYSYFGKPLQPVFTLQDAIQKGALVRYEYHPVFVSLEEDEMDAYLVLTDKISRMVASGASMEDEENQALSLLLFKRARIIGLARSKIQALRQLMETRLDETHHLFYCGAGKLVGQDDEDESKYIDTVCKVLGRELGFRVNKFVAETAPEERERLKEQLASGRLQGLVAIRCLDEGVDIPAIQTAVIMSSSSNPRQFIQRRGRILRPSEGKDRAVIYDMIVLPPDAETISEVESKLLRKEMKRYLEFAESAINSGEAKMLVLDMLKRYNLLDM